MKFTKELEYMKGKAVKEGKSEREEEKGGYRGGAMELVLDVLPRGLLKDPRQSQRFDHRTIK